MVTTALVVNYGTPEDLWRCISTAEIHDPGMHWVCWDNPHPDRSSADMLTSLQNRLGSRFTHRTGETNRGHGYGINRAAELAPNSDFYFVVNPDCEWREPVIDRLRAYLDENPDCALVGPKQMDLDWKITAGGIIGDNTEPVHRQWKAEDPQNIRVRDTVADCPTVAGSAMLVRSGAFKELGGMLEAAHYYSETWLCYHARAHGWKTAYYGDAWMIHKWHQSSPVGSKASDGKFKSDQALFRKMCDGHKPPIARD